MDKKAEFFWAIIGDSAPEPVAVTGPEGNRMAYTIGCADPFPVDTNTPSIQLISEDSFGIEPMEIPDTPKERAAARAASDRRLERDAKRGIFHGYAGFGARARRL